MLIYQVEAVHISFVHPSFKTISYLSWWTDQERAVPAYTDVLSNSVLSPLLLPREKRA